MTSRTSGARKEARYALRAVRVALTHLRHAESVQYVPKRLRKTLKTERSFLYASEDALCRLIGALK